MVTFWLLIDSIAMIGSPPWRRAAASGGCSGGGWGGGGAGGGGGGRGRERHNRGRCPSPDYLGGLGRRASICHAMPPFAPQTRISHLLVALPANLVQLCGREFHALPAQPKRSHTSKGAIRANFQSRPRSSSSWRSTSRLRDAQGRDGGHSDRHTPCFACGEHAR